MQSAGGHYRSLVEKQSMEPTIDPLDSVVKNDSEGNLDKMSSRISEGEDLMALAKSDITQLQFKDVKFAYPTRPNKPILQKFKLSVKQGEVRIIIYVFLTFI